MQVLHCLPAREASPTRYGSTKAGWLPANVLCSAECLCTAFIVCFRVGLELIDCLV